MFDANDLRKAVNRVVKGVDARLAELGDTFRTTFDFKDIPKEAMREFEVVSEAGLKVRAATLEAEENGSIHVGVLFVEGAALHPPLMAHFTRGEDGKAVYHHGIAQR